MSGNVPIKTWHLHSSILNSSIAARGRNRMGKHLKEYWEGRLQPDTPKQPPPYPERQQLSDPTRDANIAAIIRAKQMIPVHPLSGESHKRDGLEQKDISMSGRLSRRYQLWCSKTRCPSTLCTAHCRVCVDVRRRRTDFSVDRNVKICQAPTLPAVDENVLGFDVTVDNSIVVQVRQPEQRIQEHAMLCHHHTAPTHFLLCCSSSSTRRCASDSSLSASFVFS